MTWRGVLAAAVLVTAACDSTSDPPAAGQLQVNVVGLPAQVGALVTVRGPGGFSSSVTASTRLSNLRGGEYRVSSSIVRTDSTTYAPADTGIVVTVSGSTPTTATVAYALVTGRLAVILTGLPNGGLAPVTVTGPNGINIPVTASDTIGNLVPGTYTVTALNATVASEVFAPQPQQLNVGVNAVLDPTRAVISYRLISGALTVSIQGLPAGVAASVHLVGPNGVTRDLGATAAVPGLLGGQYTVVADTVRSGQQAWAPFPLGQKVFLATASSATAAVTYVAVAPNGPNYSIAGVQLQQVVQTLGNAVPLIEGRRTLLRVFVLGSTTGMVAPEVRVQLTLGQSLVTAIVPPAVSNAPTTVNDSTMQGAWNYQVPVALVKPGLTVRVDVDPNNQVAESSETDNTWPSTSAPYNVQVRSLPPLSIRFIPVTQTSTQLTGRISAANLDLFLDATNKLLPSAGVDAVIAPPFTTSAPPLVANDSNNAWSQILSEVNALRAAEGGTATYFGVVQTEYRSGLAGLAYLQGRTGIGWDNFPGATVVLAHELGHTLGRLHAPCGGAGNPDVLYPYLRGAIGVPGYDYVANGIVPPSASDIMSYCTNVWISDYTFVGMLNYRLSNSSTFVSSAAATASHGLLVWGRIERGTPILEPAFDVTAPSVASVPSPPSDRVDLLDAAGRVITSRAVQLQRVADANDATAAHFALVVPYEAMGGSVPEEVRVTARGRTAVMRASTATGQVTASRGAGDAVQLAWTDPRTRAALVRDATTGRILGIARGGRGMVRTRAQQLEVIASDGVHSRVQRLTVGPARAR